MIIRILLCLIEVIICFLLQSTVFPHIALAGVVPDLLMILVVSMAFTRGRNVGLLTGLLCGLLVDLSYGDLVGLFAFMYMLIGYLCGFSFKIYDPEDYTLPLFLVIAAELLYNLLYYVFFFLLNGKLNIGYYIYRFALPRVIYTVLISILLYKLINFLNVWQNKRREPENFIVPSPKEDLSDLYHSNDNLQ